MVLEKGRANTDKREERRKEEEEEEEEDHRYEYMSWVVWDLLSYVWKKVDSCIIVWKSSFGLESLDTWFRTLYLVYGLGLGTPKLISCRVELRRALRLLDLCFGKGLVAS